MLRALNWRRGIGFAGIHFATAAALIARDVNREWHVLHAEAMLHRNYLINVAWPCLRSWTLAGMVRQGSSSESLKSF